MRLTIDAIASHDLREFLELLRRSALCDVVVLGGAVRDCLLLRHCRDVDVAFRLTTSIPASVTETGDAGQRSAPLLVPALREALGSLAGALGCAPNDLTGGVPFEGTVIDVLGLEPVVDLKGNPFPDIFVAHDGQIFSARPELTINQIALSCHGEVWPKLHVEDLQGRVARFTNAPLSVQLRQILRALVSIREFALSPTDEVREVITAYLVRVKRSETLREELNAEDTLLLIERLLRGRAVELSKVDPGSLVTQIESLAERLFDPGVGAVTGTLPRGRP